MDRILFYDGVCGLCQFIVRFVHKFDKKNRIKFCPLQKIITSDLRTLCYFKNDKIYEKSSAVLRILYDLGFPFYFTAIFFLIPKFMRDFFYTHISKVRYSIFGKKESCEISQENKLILNKHKILDGDFERALKAFEHHENSVFLKK